MKPYTAMVPLLATALQRTGARRVLDLCSGAAGPWLWLHPVLAGLGVSVSVCLTDKYPNKEAFARLSTVTHQAISYHPQPVDAARVPGELLGFRTMFTAFHHFSPEQARAVLADAVCQRQGIGIFEAGQRSLLAINWSAIVGVDFESRRFSGFSDPLSQISTVTFLRPRGQTKQRIQFNLCPTTPT